MKKQSVFSVAAIMGALARAFGRSPASHSRSPEDRRILKALESTLPKRRVGRTYGRNGKRECTRRVRQMAAGQIRIGMVPRKAIVGHDQYFEKLHDRMKKAVA